MHHIVFDKMRLLCNAILSGIILGHILEVHAANSVRFQINYLALPQVL